MTGLFGTGRVLRIDAALDQKIEHVAVKRLVFENFFEQRSGFAGTAERRLRLYQAVQYSQIGRFYIKALHQGPDRLFVFVLPAKTSTGLGICLDGVVALVFPHDRNRQD